MPPELSTPSGVSLLLPLPNVVLSEITQSGWTLTAPAIGSWTVSLSPGVMVTGVDFGNVRDGDGDPGTFEFGGTFFPVYKDSESGHKTTVIVTRSGGSSGRATVEVEIVPLSLSGSVIELGMVTFEDGEDGPKPVTVDLASLGPPAAAYNVRLRNAAGAGLGGNTGATIGEVRSISGTVRDADGNSVSNVLVTTTDGSGDSDSDSTDSNGEYQLSVSSVGLWTVRIEPDPNSPVVTSRQVV